MLLGAVGALRPGVADAVVSLCRLWQQQGRKEAAQPMLAEIYGWFTEGFETADLKEARALLEALSSPSDCGISAAGEE